MIHIDLVAGIALGVVSCLAGVFLFWNAGSVRRRRGDFLDPAYIWHCSVCTYSYVNTKDEQISMCPRCGSYNKK